MKQIIEFFVDRGIFIHILTVFLLGWGFVSMFRAQREAFPNVNFDLATITTVYPGASPEEVEKLITIPIEESIKEVDGIKEYRSSSIENRSAIVVVIDPDADDTSQVVDDLRAAVDRADDLPEEAEKPMVIEATSSRQPVIEMTMTLKPDAEGRTMSVEEFRELGRRYEKALEAIPGVARVARRGWRDTEIQVNVDPGLLRKYEVGTELLALALVEKNLNAPGGNIEQTGTETSIRTMGAFETAAEVGAVFVRSNDVGQAIRVSDVATVVETVAKPDTIEHAGGKESLNYTVVKRSSADAITVVDAAKAVMAEYTAKHPGVTFDYLNDLSFFIKRRLNVLISNGLQGFVLVFISLFAFMGWRPAVMTALGIPFAVAGTFIILPFLGVTLNLISMFGLIIVVGMLVDDAIVVCDNIYRHLELGVPIGIAVVQGTTEVAMPVLAAVLTTVFSFAPLLFATGIFGKFLVAIPLVVILALSVSIFEAFFILPSHIHDIQAGRSVAGAIKDESHWFRQFRVTKFEPFLRAALARPWTVVFTFIGVLVFSFALWLVVGKFKLFPAAIDTFQVRITGPSGLTKDETRKFLQAVEYEALRLPKEELDRVAGRVGIIQKDNNDPFTRRGSQYGQVMVYLTPQQDRERKSDLIMREIRNRTAYLLNPDTLAKIKTPLNIEPTPPPPEFADLAGRLHTLEFEQLAGGPPVGKPIAIRIMGDDLSVLRKLADEYIVYLSKIPGVRDIGTDSEEGKNEIRLYVDERLAAQAGVSVARIATAVNTAFEGIVATSIRRANEEVDVRIRFAEPYTQSKETLRKIFVTNQRGNLVPVSTLARFEQTIGITSIQHFNGQRLITVGGDVDDRIITSQEVNTRLAQETADFPKRYPGATVKPGGEFQDTQESVSSLGYSFLVGFIINFMLLASMFRSMLKPLIILAAIPFSFIGVIFAFILHNEPLSFLAIMGVVGLSGVVVNDSIVLVDYANQLSAERPGDSLLDLVVEATSTRLRAVLLTTITTVLGLLPTAYGIGGYDPFLVPMALSFAWGLAVATFLTLLLVPVLYYLVGRREHGRSLKQAG